MLVPSLIGSYIYRKNNGASEPHYVCQTVKRGWKRIWPPAVSQVYYVPYALCPCFACKLQ